MQIEAFLKVCSSAPAGWCLSVRPSLSGTVASAGCPLARRARVTSLAHCLHYSSWSIILYLRLCHCCIFYSCLSLSIFSQRMYIPMHGCVVFCTGRKAAQHAVGQVRCPSNVLPVLSVRDSRPWTRRTEQAVSVASQGRSAAVPVLQTGAWKPHQQPTADRCHVYSQ